MPAVTMRVDFRPAVHVTGFMLVGLGIAMLLPAAVDFALGDLNAGAFLQSALVTAFIGAMLALSAANPNLRAIDVRQGFLLTLSIWIVLPVFGALPLHLGAPELGWTDAIFEGVSGLTTTGSTVIVGLDDLPAGMNLWRGMLNWLGGLGIAFVAMIFLPVMRVGGMQFFRSEGFDTLGKALPRAADIALALVRVYALLTVACMLTYAMLGMTPLDAVVNALATTATGGFSPSDASFGKYPGAAEYAGGVLMILAAMPYIRYVQLIAGSPAPLWRDAQARAFVQWVAVAVALVTLWRVATSDMGLEPAFRETFFNLSSVMTGTGFVSGSFGDWAGFSMVVAFTVGMIGGCSGSSSAALTVFRVQVVVAAVRAALRRIDSPHRVDPVKYDGRAVSADALNGVILYLTSFLVLIFVVAIVMTMQGMDLTSAVFGAWTSLGNIGYGYGPITARTGTMVDVSTGSKWVMILCMVTGRLGLLAFLVVFLPQFWRG
jgi:trk system potassium uptake protein TrkH